MKPEFNDALAVYLWAWFILTVIYTVAAMRSSWILFLDLFVLDINLMILACAHMLNNTTLLKVGNALGFVVTLLSCKMRGPRAVDRTNSRIDWAGAAGLFVQTTPFKVPVFPMYQEPAEKDSKV